MNREVVALVEGLGPWASVRPDVVGLLLVGSNARDDAGPDSDVDLVLLTTRAAGYADDRWAADLDLGAAIRAGPGAR